MKFLRQLYYFLGSIYLAITLIALTALFVIAGTLIESVTESHRYAAYFTYQNPVFIVLLWGFFINILISSLHRWPFRLRHIPFLITHLGLLMVLSGALIKSYFGVQGTMGIIEGSGSHEIFMADTYVIHVEKRERNNSLSAPTHSLINHFPLPRNWLGQFHSQAISSDLFPELELRLVEYTPHSQEQIETWIKDNQGYISGIKPFPIYALDDLADLAILPVSTEAHLHRNSSVPWCIIAGKSTKVEEIAHKVYLQELEIIISDTATQVQLFRGPLKKALEQPIAFDNYIAKIDLNFNYTSTLGFEDPQLSVNVKSPTSNDIIHVPLQDPGSLINNSILTPFLGKAPISIDLRQKPTLLLLQNDQSDNFLFAFDPCGRVHAQSFRNNALRTYISYDQGYGGYAIQAKLPVSSDSNSRSDCEQAALIELKKQLKIYMEPSSTLSLPLELLRNAAIASGANFANTTVDFLSTWNNTHGWLYPENLSFPKDLNNVMKNIDWNNLSINKRNACGWLQALAGELEPSLKQNQDLLILLKQNDWPLLDQLKVLKQSTGHCTAEETDLMLTALAQQVFSISSILPDQEIAHNPSLNMSPRLLSALFRAYGIHLNSVSASMSLPIQSSDTVTTLECPLTFKQKDLSPKVKLEENLPKITLQIKRGSETEFVTLSYDRFGQGLKHPIFHGEYLIRFQPLFEKIPYHIRLRHARQINYANSTQPYSYESDLLITDRERNLTMEKTLSMNRVHETWEGYRFYLANIAPANESAVKRVQIIVNHDPAKYWLTYPGAFVLSLGIILLFWFKRH